MQSGGDPVGTLPSEPRYQCPQRLGQFGDTGIASFVEEQPFLLLADTCGNRHRSPVDLLRPLAHQVEKLAIVGEDDEAIGTFQRYQHYAADRFADTDAVALRRNHALELTGHVGSTDEGRVDTQAVTSTHERLIEKADGFGGLVDDGRHALEHQATPRTIGHHAQAGFFVGTVQPGNHILGVDAVQRHELKYRPIGNRHTRPCFATDENGRLVRAEPYLLDLEAIDIALVEYLHAVVDEHLARDFVDHLCSLRLFQTNGHAISLFLQSAFDLKRQTEDVAEYLVDECGKLHVLHVQTDVSLLVVEDRLVHSIDYTAYDRPRRCGRATELRLRNSQRCRSFLSVVAHQGYALGCLGFFRLREQWFGKLQWGSTATCQ